MSDAEQAFWREIYLASFHYNRSVGIDENEDRAQRIVDLIESGEEPVEREVRERAPRKYYGEPRPRRPNPYFQKFYRKKAAA